MDKLSKKEQMKYSINNINVNGFYVMNYPAY